MSEHDFEDNESDTPVNPYDAFREKYTGLSVVDLAHQMKLVQQNKEVADLAAKLIGAEYDFLRLTLIPSICEELGIEGMKIEGLGRLGLTPDMHVSVKSGQMSDFFDWLRDCGKGDLIKEQINSSTLKALVKTLLKKGEEIPSEMLNVNPFTRASITRQ